MRERTLEMSHGEIERYYRAAKSKNMVIQILADLNCCSKEIIRGILDGSLPMEGNRVQLDNLKRPDRKEEKRKYYTDNREKLLKDRRERYQKNRERCLEYSRQYYRTHDRSKYFRKRWQEKKAQKVAEVLDT